VAAHSRSKLGLELVRQLCRASRRGGNARRHDTCIARHLIRAHSHGYLVCRVEVQLNTASAGKRS